MMTIDSHFTSVGLLEKFDQTVIKNEPMLFNCDWEHAEKLGGPITNDFLSKIPPYWRSTPCVIDTRVHMLMPGWYPCIPGWHHDDVPRTRSDGQPNYLDERQASHIIGLQNGDVCPTQLAMGRAEFHEVPLGQTVYSQWNGEVDEHVRTFRLGTTHILDRELLLIDDRTWHRCQGATGSGWRWFGRISRYWLNGSPIERGNSRSNEIRKQVQVYIDPINKGW